MTADIAVKRWPAPSEMTESEKEEVREALAVLHECGVDAYVIGRIVEAGESGERIRIC